MNSFWVTGIQFDFLHEYRNSNSKLIIAENIGKSLNDVGFLVSDCTEIHIGHGIVITTGHCFHATETRRSGHVVMRMSGSIEYRC